MNTNRISLLTRIIVVLAVSVAVFWQALPVSANPPVRERVLWEDYVLSGLCDFDVLVTSPDEKLYETTFYDQDGEIFMVIDSGKVFVTLTNLSTGATLDANVSGPGQTIYHPDGSIHFQATGSWLLWGPPNELIGFPPLVLTAGNASADWDSGGNLVDISFHGQYTDLCAELSG